MASPFTAVTSATLDRPGMLEPGLATALPVVALPTLATTALPYIAHVYDNSGLNFKQTLSLQTRPALKYTLNGGYQPLTLDIATSQVPSVYGSLLYGGGLYGAGIGFGDLVRLTEQGGDGAVLYTGIVEDSPDLLDPQGANYSIVLTPLVATLGDTYFNGTFTNVDVATMVHAAINATRRLSSSPRTVSDTGVIRSYAFNNTTALDVLNVCRQMAGVNWFWFVDAIGQVWFQQASTGSKPTYSVTANQYQLRRRTANIKLLKNRITVVGGIPAGGSAPITAVYNSSSSQAQYGVRHWDPPPTYPGVTDQATLNAIATMLGAAFDRVQNVVEITLPNFGQRVSLAQPGGATLRTWEPAANSLVESEIGPGLYSTSYVVLDVEIDGPQQKLVCADVPIANLNDYQATVDAIVQRTSLNPIVYPSASLAQMGTYTSTGGLRTAPDIPAGSPPGTAPPARWALDAKSFRTNDGTATDYGAPSGAGVTTEFGANGIGFLSKLVLQSAATGARLILDSAAALFKITDGTRDRVSFAVSLPAYTDPNGIVSPLGTQGRAVDVNGNLLWDTSGIVSGAVVPQLQVGSVTLNQVVTSTGWTTVASVPFTLARKGAVLAWINGNASVTAGVGSGMMNLSMDGGAPPSLNAGWNNGDSKSNFMLMWVFTGLAAGAHTLSAVGSVSVGTVSLTTTAWCTVAQFGA